MNINYFAYTLEKKCVFLIVIMNRKHTRDFNAVAFQT